MSLHYAQLRRYDVANGEGIRTSLFVTGCTLRCPDCFNVLYQDPNYGTEWSDETTREVIRYLQDPNVAGLTILGGEPMQNLELIPVVQTIREAIPPDKTIWIYSGYTFEQIIRTPERRVLLALCDVLVDGRFVAALKDLRLRFRGSSNQRILAIAPSLEAGRPIPYSPG